jgi:pimeloyl-ACP methyl ester carboxylesterase
MQLHHRAYGSGPAVILLHGLLGSADNWHPVAQALAGRFQVFALDQRNHGQSPHAGEMNYRLMAEDVHEFMETNGIARAVVAGHSMGGKTAMQLALQFPHRVEKLIVEDMSPRAYPPAYAPILAALRALDLSQFASRAAIEQALAPEIPSLTLRQFLLKNLTRDAAGNFCWKINLSGLVENYPRLGEPIAHPEPSRPEPFLKPALFVRGGKSDYLAEADEPLIRELFPNAEIQTIAAAGHWIHADQLAAFLALTLDFLSR